MFQCKPGVGLYDMYAHIISLWQLFAGLVNTEFTGSGLHAYADSFRANFKGLKSDRLEFIHSNILCLILLYFATFYTAHFLPLSFNFSFHSTENHNYGFKCDLIQYSRVRKIYV